MTADAQTRSARERRANLVVGPDLLDSLQHRVKPATPTGQLYPAYFVVVIAAPEANTKREAPAGEGVETECLLGKLDRVDSERSEQDRRVEPNPLGNSRGPCECDQRLVVVVDDAVDRPKAREAACVGAASPLDQLPARRPRHSIGQPDRNVHLLPPLPTFPLAPTLATP
ncbi:MAG TPA: hypothetical protein VIY71_01090 [Solirubrobacterales bacterium]